MTDVPRFHAVPPETLLRLELWAEPRAAQARFKRAFDAALPGPGQAFSAGAWRVIWREPRAWMIRAPLVEREALAARLAEIAGDDGAVTDISGAAVRCAIRGRDWRILLTHGGVFDAEDADFRPGSVAGTVVEHMSVRFDVIAEDQVDAYVAPSFAHDLFGYWTSVARRLEVRG
ncbi:sarcosine oxidase subunit gamma family protein [Phenylobacterium sp.]|uniref:sarcosine oxidase subunit gamma family protein n=1 Tax=Phenylobacterium sp. TaxID=1871053 RepID=UPI00286C8081|nr:sarcosine oxidase subunit gamma family protein [Phenylobacterium sp.]